MAKAIVNSNGNQDLTKSFYIKLRVEQLKEQFEEAKQKVRKKGALEMYKDEHLGGYGHEGDSHSWCPDLWCWALKTFHIRSVLDIGCGEGQSTKFFKDMGCDVLGVEGSLKAIKDSVIPQYVKRHDFCDGAFIPEKQFDMIWCCEFLEHVDEKYLSNIMETLKFASKVIMLTHAETGQIGHHHVNCQESDYWIRHIENLGFSCRIDLTKTARIKTLKDFSGINYFVRTGLIFIRLDPTDLPHRKRSILSPEWRAKWESFLVKVSFKFSKEYRQRRKTMRFEKRKRKRISLEKTLK